MNKIQLRLFIAAILIFFHGDISIAKPMSLEKEEVQIHYTNIKNEKNTNDRIIAAFNFEKRVNEVVRYLDQTFTKEETNKFVSLYEREQIPEIKLALSISLAIMGDQTTVPFLISMLDENRLQDIKIDRSEYFSSRFHQDKIRSLNSVLNNIQNDDLRGAHPEHMLAYILGALRWTQDERVIEPVLKIFNQRKQAVKQWKGDSKKFWLNIQVLISASNTLADGATREVIEILLGDLAKKSEIEDSIRYVALMALEEILRNYSSGAENFVPAIARVLIDLVKNDPNQQIRTLLASSLRYVLNEQGVRGALWQVVYEDRSDLVHTAALRSIWKTHDQWYAYGQQIAHESILENQLFLLKKLVSFGQNHHLSRISNTVLHRLTRIRKETKNSEIQKSISQIISMQIDWELDHYQKQIEEWKDNFEEWNRWKKESQDFIRQALDRRDIIHNRLLALKRISQLRSEFTETQLKKLSEIHINESDSELNKALSKILTGENFELKEHVIEKGYETSFKNGQKNGVERIFNGDGQLLIEQYYKENRLDGTRKKFNVQGKLIKETQYKNGKRHGWSKGYYDDGKLNYEWNYENDKLVGTGREYYPNGQLRGERTCIDGTRDFIQKQYNRSGELIYEGRITDGNFSKVGEQTSP